MNTAGRKVKAKADKAYYARCIRQLKEWGAPVTGWRCVDIIDVREDDYDAPLSECELCGCAHVRYEHVMDNDLYFEPVTVGCICAGIMEGDILAAEEREHQMRNRSKRKRNFLKHEWRHEWRGLWHRTYRGREVQIRESGGRYSVHAGNKATNRYKGKPIMDFYSAIYAAFEIADPVEDIVCAKNR